MKIVVFSNRRHDETFLRRANHNFLHNLTFLELHLTPDTAQLAKGHDGVCVFVNDTVTGEVIQELATLGVRIIALRCAGYNNVDLEAATRSGIPVVRVPAYSPHAVAEHTVALILTLNRHIHKAYNRVREGNFALDGLLGFDLVGKTVGVVGTGRIGEIFCRIMNGFGCRVLAHDVQENHACLDLGVTYVPLPEILGQSDIVSLHCPLTPETQHLINAETLRAAKDGFMLINTSRGGLIDTPAAIAGLKSGKIGALGLDVYEEEGDLFFEDLSNQVIQDDVLTRLTTFPNVVVTGHQAFFTREAMQNIAETTLQNLTEFEETGRCRNSVGEQKGPS